MFHNRPGLMIEDDVLDYIFKNILHAKNGQGACAYDINIKALEVAQQYQVLTPSFLATLLDTRYHDTTVIADKDYHYYTQRLIISQNPETLYAYLSFLLDKDSATFNQVFPPEFWALTPSPNVILQAITGDNLCLTNGPRYKPIIFDILDDQEKLYAMLNAIFYSQLDDDSTRYTKKDFATSKDTFKKLCQFIHNYSPTPLLIDSFINQLRNIIASGKSKIVKSILKDVLYEIFPENTSLDRLHEQHKKPSQRILAFFKFQARVKDEKQILTLDRVQKI